MFGPGSVDVFRSGDDAADAEAAARVKALIAEKVAFEEIDANTRVALFGEKAWPFPIPLAKAGERWRFDTEAGRQELLNRRIGYNELATLSSLHAYVDAQFEYHSQGRDGLPPAFAQQVRSNEGKQDGLYWATAEGEDPSPLGDLLAEATVPPAGAEPVPFQGYYYRILKAQGKSAPGGERSYLDDKGLMTGGFAAIAWPAKYGNSGVMTFLISSRDIIFQKDLGAETAQTRRGDHDLRSGLHLGADRRFDRSGRGRRGHRGRCSIPRRQRQRRNRSAGRQLKPFEFRAGRQRPALGGPP